MSLLAHAADTLSASPIVGLAGHTLGPVWILPFMGLLISLSFIPVLLEGVWHRHYGKIVTFWSLMVTLPLMGLQGFPVMLHTICATYLDHFFPFILMISTLYVLTGHLRLHIALPASPVNNTLVLACASLIANCIGTTGASMLFIRPFLEMNKDRSHKTHSIIFFIFLVGNIGGSLSPLGDPPLFIGFLSGIHFFWPSIFLFQPFALLWISLLGIYYSLDAFLLSKTQNTLHRAPPTSGPVLSLEGQEQIPLFISFIVVLFVTGYWHSTITFSFMGVILGLQHLVRDGACLLIIFLSFRLGHRQNRSLNRFTWGPLIEIFILFAGIFITAAPVISILQAGESGALQKLIMQLNNEGKPMNGWYFWGSGILSAFLDNAPTYLAFFHLAGGDPSILMGPSYKTLQALSCGSVFMGALTYIGNAPNFMIKAIAEENAISMPSFFGYMLWGLFILIPLFIVLTLFFFL